MHTGLPTRGTVTPEFRKAEALLAMGRAEEAAAMMDGLPARETPDAEFHRLRGRALRAVGRVFDAESSFREALSLSPNDPSLLADLATTLLGQRRLKEALPFAREAVSLRPETPAFYCLVAVIAEGLSLDREAKDALTLARKLAPADPEPHTLSGFLLLRCGELPEAQAAFEQALAADPGRAEALKGLARCCIARKDWDGARRHWLESLSLDPTQRDKTLDRWLWLGHPLATPLRGLILVRLPIALSIALLAFLAYNINQILLAGGLLVLAALPSLTRLLLPRLP